MYIHAVEMSPHPERALRACDALRDLAPDVGHLRHMPSHIDVLCGSYCAALVANDRAIEADRKYLEREGPINFYTLSRVHDLHFKVYAAMFLGQYRPALEAANELIATTPEALLRVTSPAMADWLEAFVAMKLHVLVRFGKWQEILDEPLPQDPVLTDILAIAAAMLRGEIEYRKGNHEQAFAHLRTAVELDDNLPFDEPWGWMQPVRHALGALLLEQDRVDEAVAVYRADLGFDPTLSRAKQHPDNVWSLYGYVECLRRLGRQDELGSAQLRLELAAARADAGIAASCFCRVGRDCCG